MQSRFGQWAVSVAASALYLIVLVQTEKVGVLWLSLVVMLAPFVVVLALFPPALRTWWRPLSIVALAQVVFPSVYVLFLFVAMAWWARTVLFVDGGFRVPFRSPSSLKAG